MQCSLPPAQGSTHGLSLLCLAAHSRGTCQVQSRFAFLETTQTPLSNAAVFPIDLQGDVKAARMQQAL